MIFPFLSQGCDCCLCKYSKILLTQLGRDRFICTEAQRYWVSSYSDSVFSPLSVPLVTMQTAGPEIEDSFDFLFKIILVGDSDVGKTCVVQSFKSGIFIEKQQNTIGVDFTVRTLDIDGKKVKVDDFYFKHLHHS